MKPCNYHERNFDSEFFEDAHYICKKCEERLKRSNELYDFIIQMREDCKLDGILISDDYICPPPKYSYPVKLRIIS